MRSSRSGVYPSWYWYPVGICAEGRQLVPINFGYADTHLTGAYSTAPVSTRSSSSSSSLSPSSFEQSTLGYIHRTTLYALKHAGKRANEDDRRREPEKGTTGWRERYGVGEHATGFRDNAGFGFGVGRGGIGRAGFAGREGATRAGRGGIRGSIK